MKVSIPSAARVLPRRSSAAVIGEQRTGSDDLGKQKLYKENKAAAPACAQLFQKEIHAIEIDYGVTDVQRVHAENAADSRTALPQGEMR